MDVTASPPSRLCATEEFYAASNVFTGIMSQSLRNNKLSVTHKTNDMKTNTISNDFISRPSLHSTNDGILLQDEISGLQVLNNQEWIVVPSFSTLKESIEIGRSWKPSPTSDVLFQQKGMILQVWMSKKNNVIVEPMRCISMEREILIQRGDMLKILASLLQIHPMLISLVSRFVHRSAQLNQNVLRNNIRGMGDLAVLGVLLPVEQANRYVVANPQARQREFDDVFSLQSLLQISDATLAILLLLRHSSNGQSYTLQNSETIGDGRNGSEEKHAPRKDCGEQDRTEKEAGGQRVGKMENEKFEVAIFGTNYHARLGEQDQQDWLERERQFFHGKKRESPFLSKRAKFQ
eukprot:Gb_07718 [translate_table: standard]